MGIYEELGLRPVINGYATVTRLGGSLMPPPVVEAMIEASRQFVELEDLQAAVGRRIAKLTRNEAAYVSSGAAAGLTLATAACVAGTDPDLIAALPHPQRVPGARCEVIFQRCQRSGYDYAVRQVGVDMIEIGPEQSSPTDFPAVRRELEQALSERTAAVLYFARGEDHSGGLPLAEVVAAAHARGVPVIVDAAAQLPPVENLWRFTQEGADLVIFSGGKGLCGPQATGLVLGRPDLIKACAVQGNPNQAIGRPMKVGERRAVRLLGRRRVVRRLGPRSHDGPFRGAGRYRRRADRRAAGGHGASRDAQRGGATAATGTAALRRGGARDRAAIRSWSSCSNGEPAIELSPEGDDGIYVNPQTLMEGEEVVIADRLAEILG